MNSDTECIRDDLEGLDGDIAFASLDLAHVSPIEPRAIGKDILRPMTLQAERPDRRANLLLNVLHS